MKKHNSILIMFTLIFSFYFCGNSDDSSSPIQIITDKNRYSTDENVVIKVSNLSDSTARFFICSSYKGIPPAVYKLKKDNWTSYWAPICDGFRSYCCGELSSGDTYKDTLELDFEPGYYRIAYMFIIEPDHDYVTYFSNEFHME